jgi:hypothetical protein
MPGGLGQSLTTIVTTITTPVTTVATVNSTVGSTQGLSTELHTDAYTTPFVIQPTQGTYGCIYQALPFTANNGEAISVDVKSSIPISIYIMTAVDYQAWLAGNSCAAASSVLYSREQVSSVYIDMIAPSSGGYDLVLLNLSPTNSASVNVGYTGISQAVTTVFLPVVSAFALTETYTATSTLTEVQPVTEPLQQYGLYAIIFVLVLALGFLALRRRSSKKTVGTATVATGETAPVSGRFCGDCGKPIPIDAEFCPKCGASTEGG